jgi:dephospho-CoA kinase
VILVGLFGKIAAGKSAFASQLADHGAVVIDADRVAHQVLQMPEVCEALAARFGRDLLDHEGHIRRSALAAIVFGPGPEAAQALEDLVALVHPLIRTRIENEIERIRTTRSTSAAQLVIVLDIPLLVQSGWANRCDRIIEVRCNEGVRMDRLQHRGWSAEMIAQRDAAWNRKMPHQPLRDLEKAGKIRTVDTSSEISYTSGEVQRIWEWLRATPRSETLRDLPADNS